MFPTPEIENDTLDHTELKEIKLKDDNKIFEVPGPNENLRR
jgi:hypothetical protein